MKSSPAFQFYPADFLADENVAAMTLAECGAYIKLLCFCWREGSIPADISRIARLLKEDNDAMASLWPAVKPCFIEDPKDATRLVQPRLQAERQKQADHRRRLSEAGSAGAKSVWDKRKQEFGLAISPPQPRHGNANGPAMPLQSSSSSSPSGSGSVTKEEVAQRQRTPQQELGELYRQLWLERYPDGKCSLDRKHFVMFAKILTSLDGDLACAGAAVRRYMACTDPFLTDKAHPVELLTSGLSRYTTAGAKTTPTSRVLERPLIRS